jgi:hypothetical protein
MTQTTTTYELQPRNDSAKSFYKKAYVKIDGNRSILVSYTTEVACITSGTTHAEDKVEVYGTYGATTLRHIKEFLKQFGHTADTKKQIERDYMTPECPRHGRDSVCILCDISSVMN